MWGNQHDVQSRAPYHPGMHRLLTRHPRLSETVSPFLPYGQPFQGAWNDNSILWLSVDDSLKTSPIVGLAVQCQAQRMDL